MEKTKKKLISQNDRGARISRAPRYQSRERSSERTDDQPRKGIRNKKRNLQRSTNPKDRTKYRKLKEQAQHILSQRKSTLPDHITSLEDFHRKNKNKTTTEASSIIVLDQHPKFSKKQDLKLLGLNQNATEKEVARALKHIQKRNHPDTFAKQGKRVSREHIERLHLSQAAADRLLNPITYQQETNNVVPKIENKVVTTNPLLQIALEKQKGFNFGGLEFQAGKTEQPTKSLGESDSQSPYPLHQAAAKNNIEKIQQLLESQYNKTDLNRDGETPYDVALQYQNVDAAELLSYDIEDLISAVDENNYDLCKKLIEYDPELVKYADDAKDTALDFASATNADDDIIDLLIESNATYNKPETFDYLQDFEYSEYIDPILKVIKSINIVDEADHLQLYKSIINLPPVIKQLHHKEIYNELKERFPLEASNPRGTIRDILYT